MALTTEQLVQYLSDKVGSEISSADISAAASHFNVSDATAKKRLESYKSGRGKWNLTVAERLEQTYQAPATEKVMVPEKDDNFVPFGNFSDLHKILKSNMFYPTFITGLSGNGKTTMIQQACASLRRECFRVNITSATDEDDLLGGFRLINGETVWQDGPVTTAMRRGAVLF